MIFVLQSDQPRYRCGPTLGSWRPPPHRRMAALLPQLVTMSRLPLGSSLLGFADCSLFGGRSSSVACDSAAGRCGFRTMSPMIPE